jgi:predicted NAD/FAD-dependent oxidoreductase
MTSIAILGAASSGLAAAHTLCDAGHVVTLFEQSRDAGGRATTRKGKGFIYDSGAQYIKPGSSVSISLVTERFRAPDLIDISKPVWIFDGTGRIQEGDPRQNAEPKWCYRSGLITLAQRMAEGLDIRFETPIHHIQQAQTGWSLFDTLGQQRGQFERLLVTLPAPQARELIAVSPGADDLRTAICSQLDKAHYNPLLSVMLGYRPTPQLRPYYALVNTDKAHAISWLAWEHEKAAERVPEGTGLLIAQMAPQYSHEQWHTPGEALVQDVAQRVAALIDEHLPTPSFTDVQHWRYALPSERADAAALNALALPYGLAFCGDAFVGGRVHLALEHGVSVAQQMIASL